MARQPIQAICRDGGFPVRNVTLSASIHLPKRRSVGFAIQPLRSESSGHRPLDDESQRTVPFDAIEALGDSEAVIVYLLDDDRGIDDGLTDTQAGDGSATLDSV